MHFYLRAEEASYNVLMQRPLSYIKTAPLTGEDREQKKSSLNVLRKKYLCMCGISRAS